MIKDLSIRCVALKDISLRFRYRRDLDDKDNIIGCFIKDTLVGILVYDEHEENNELHLMFIEVLYEHRDRGVCKLLIDYIIKETRPKGVRLIPATYESKLVFEKLISEGILPSNTSLEG